MKKNNLSYTIKEVSELSGLPESTLRYYETIGLIDSIKRDSSSKHRTYDEDNLNLIIAVSCLSATGMSIEDMRTYLSNLHYGKKASHEQITLLKTQKDHLVEEAHYLKLRRQYVDIKIAYWSAVATGDKTAVETAIQSARKIAKELKASKNN